MNRKTNGVTTTVLAAVVVVVIVIAGIGYALYATRGTTTQTTTTQSTSSTTSAPSTTSSTTSSSTSPSSQAYSVMIGSSSSLGNYLENGTGFTLYMFGKDIPGNGTSACTGACAAVWKPFYASNLRLPSSLSSSNFTAITRSDGSKQTAYNGWPLYYFSSDSSSGSMIGEGANQYGGLWYAMPPTLQQTGGQIIGGSTYTIGIAYLPSIGIYLTNSSGFTLYYRSSDAPNSGNTTCNTSVCETNWPLFYQSSLNLPPGLSPSQFSTITPYNSTKITTYNGYALFYWLHDAKPGDATGQGIGNFYVATLPLAGTTTTSTSAASSSSSTTTSSSSTSTSSAYTYPY